VSADGHTPGTESWAAHSGTPLLRTLANALVALQHQNDLDAFTLPYPAEAQRALDRVSLAFLLLGAEPPAGLPALIELCTYPLGDWPSVLPPDVVNPDDRLLDEYSARPTDLCHEWAERSPDAAVRHYDREVIGKAFTLCREYGEERAYTAFRELLVTRPVLTPADMFIELGNTSLVPVHDLIRSVYAAVPDSYLRNGEYLACRHCLTLLTPVRDGGWWCERDRCRRRGPAVPGRRFVRDESGEIRQLDRPLRQFVTGPGRAEVELRDELTALGITIRMWPGYDAYDLLATFPDGHRWAIDVKDRANPCFLGREARAVPPHPPYDEAFWVVPRHRVNARPGYLADYERNRPAEAVKVPLVVDDVLVRRAAGRLRGSKRTGRGDRHA
jgi:hypothetical protein